MNALKHKKRDRQKLLVFRELSTHIHYKYKESKKTYISFPCLVIGDL